MYAARRTGLKKEMFGYVRGGYARILEAFGRLLGHDGVQCRLGCRVNRVSGGAVETGDGQRESFDRVVVTSPAPLADRLCEGLSPDERERLNGIRYQGIVCASLLLKQPLAGYYVTNITDDGLPFTAVIETTALVEREQLGGHCLVYLPKYVTPDDPFLQATDDEVRERFL